MEHYTHCCVAEFSSVPQGEIHRVKSDGTNRTEFAPAAILGSPVGLALDWITQNLYYTNPATQSIEVAISFGNELSHNMCSTLMTSASLCSHCCRF